MNGPFLECIERFRILCVCVCFVLAIATHMLVAVPCSYVRNVYILGEDRQHVGNGLLIFRMRDSHVVIHNHMLRKSIFLEERERERDRRNSRMWSGKQIPDVRGLTTPV